MSLTFTALLLTLALFVAIIVCMEVGRRLGRVALARNTDGLPKGIGAAEGAIFGLLGLLIAFTFSGAAGRFEDRRHLITEEANDIGTAWLRIDLLPADAQPEMRELFRRYLDSRLAVYTDVHNPKTIAAKLAASAELQNQIWAKATQGAHRPGAASSAPMLLLPALNAMFDITTTRTRAAQNHPPLVVFLLLPTLVLIASILVGFDLSENKVRQPLHILAFAAVMSLTVYVIVDLEFPRFGLIRVDTSDQVLLELRQSMD